MYGTDWVMLSRAIGVETYFANMRDRLARQLRIPAQDFLGMNAARFLGLDQPRGNRPGTTQRLEDFYLAKGKPPNFLKRWQSVA